MPFTISATLPAERTPLVTLAIESVQVFTEPDVKNILPRFSGMLADDYHHKYLPGEGLPEFTSKEQFFKHLESMFPMFGEVNVSS